MILFLSTIFYTSSKLAVYRQPFTFPRASAHDQDPSPLEKSRDFLLPKSGTGAGQNDWSEEKSKKKGPGRLGDVRAERAWRAARFPALVRFSRKPFPVIGIVYAGTIIHPIPLSHILLLGPLHELPEQEISGNY